MAHKTVFFEKFSLSTCYMHILFPHETSNKSTLILSPNLWPIKQSFFEKFSLSTCYMHILFPHETSNKFTLILLSNLWPIKQFFFRRVFPVNMLYAYLVYSFEVMSSPRNILDVTTPATIFLITFLS